MAGLNWLIQQFRRVLGTGGHSDGMTVDKALSYPPVWHAVSKISGHIAYLPLNLHRETTRAGKTKNEKPTNHAGYRLMRVRANAYQTPFVFKRQLMVHALMLGNGYAYIKRDGLMSELWPLMPDRLETRLVMGEKIHFYKPDRDEKLSLEDDIQQAIEKSKKEGKAEVIPLRDSEVLHIPGLSYDGFSGKSVLSLAARSFNLGIGAEVVERTRQKRGYSGGVMLEAPEGVLTKQKDAEEFIEAWDKRHGGEENAGKAGLLTRGVKANVLQMSNLDSQFLENRKFQRQDTALMFMLEHILGDDSSVSYNSLEQKNLAYLQNCLSAWMKTWEEECETKLLTPAEQQGGYYFKFNDGALLRTDKQTTATIISILRGCETINANEARGWLDLNPYEGGDDYANPNTKSAGGDKRVLSAAEAIQKVYLGVNKVVTSDEARRIVNSESEAGLDVPGPAFATQAASPFVQNRIEQLLNTEGKQVIAACNAKNFCARIESLYEKWSKTWAKDIGEDAAKAHCESSKAELLECADKAKTQDELTELVTQLVATWPAKASELAKDLALC